MSALKETLILNSLLNSTKSIIYFYDLENNRIRFLNQGIYTDLGYDRIESDTVSQEKFFEMIHEDDRANYLSYIESVVFGREKKYSVVDYRIRTKRGDWRWYTDTISILNGGMGIEKELIGYAVDISSFKRKEETYLREEIRLKAILENTREYYFFLDLEFKILSLNKNAKNFLQSRLNLIMH